MNRAYARFFFLLILIALVGALWYAALSRHEKRLTVAFLDVGQGDSIFIESPSGAQMLIDGGATSAVLRELPKVMGPFDRSLDVIVATHPDMDHIGGLVDVFRRYKVGMFVESGNKGDTGTSEALDRAADAEEAPRVIARRGMRIMLGDGAYADILFPDRDVSKVETNTASIVMRVVYGDTSFMLTGDSPQAIEKYSTTIYGSALASDVLKAGHHGSRTSSSEEFVRAVSPRYAVFSRGCDNTYGHPHQEVVELFARLGTETRDTCKDGTIVFRSEGKVVRVR